MDIERLCFGCFREKSGPVCPYCGFDPQSEPQPVLALPLGTVLGGRYLTGKVLGIGGFGVTYLGYDLTLDIKVAIKEYLPSGMAARGVDRYTMSVVSSREEDAYRSGEERFLDEARILAKLQHVPNIVSVQNYFRENNTAYFVMDYIDGMSLKTFLERQGGKIPYQQALTILSPVMEALSEVHAQSLLHRDISPDNIYITSAGQSKLLDFGAARFAIGDERSMSVILKHGYAPEEQYRTHGNQGPWTDVYAMGATLYRCITGTLPPDSIDRLHSDSLIAPSALGAALPPQAEAALLRALGVRAEDRFADMASFLRALHGQTGEQTAKTIAASLDATHYAPPEPQAAGSTQKRSLLTRLKTDRRFALIAGGAALAVVLAVVLIVALAGGGRSSTVADGGGAGGAGGGAASLPPIGTLAPAPATAAPSKSYPLTAYDMPRLGFSIGIPEGFSTMESEADSGLVIQDGTSMVVVSYSYYAEKALYDLSDVRENEKTVCASLLKSLGITDYTLEAGEETTINGREGYLVECNGSENIGMLLLTPMQGDCGCYVLFYAIAKEDADGESMYKAFACMDSFTVTGRLASEYSVMNAKGLGFRFMYNKALCAGGTDVRLSDDGKFMCAYLYPNEDDVRVSVEVERAESYAQTADDAINYIGELLENNVPSAKFVGNRQTYMLNGNTFIVDEYTATADGTEYGMAFFSTDIGGNLIAAAVIYDSYSKDEAIALFNAVMSSVEPA